MSKDLRAKFERIHMDSCLTKKGRFTKRYTEWLEKEVEWTNKIKNDVVLGDVSNCDYKCPVPYKDGNNILACRKCHNEI